MWLFNIPDLDKEEVVSALIVYWGVILLSVGSAVGFAALGNHLRSQKQSDWYELAYLSSGCQVFSFSYGALGVALCNRRRRELR